MNSRPSSQSRMRSSSGSRRTSIPCLKSDSAKSTLKSRKPLLVRSKSSLSVQSASASPFTTPRIHRESRRNYMSTQCERQSRPRTKLDTPVSCRPSDLLSPTRYETIKLRVNVSPLRLKQQYTNLDEKKHLPRISKFVETHGLPYIILKPVTINAFINVTQAFVKLLCSPLQPPLTSKNYKTEMPKLLKDLEYPININQSFLKTPNTPQHFSNVLAIWTFLMDLVDIFEEPVELPPMADTFLKYYANTGSKEEAMAELARQQFANVGCTPQTSIEELKNETIILQGQLAKKENELCTLEAKLASTHEQGCLVKLELETIANQNNALDKELISIQEEFDYNSARLLKSQIKLSGTEEALNEIRNKIDTFSFSLDDVQRVTDQLEIRARRLQKIKARNEMFAEQFREKQDQQKEIYMKADALLIDYNTTLTLSQLPEGEKSALKLNEDNMQLAQIKKVSNQVFMMMQREEIINQERHALLDTNTDMLLTCERQLAEAMVQAEEKVKQRKDRDMRINEERAQINAINENSEKVVEKIIMFREAIPQALKRRTETKAAIEKHTKETTDTLTKMRDLTDKTNKLIKEKAGELQRLQKEGDAKKLANAVEFKAKLDDLIQNSTDSN